MPADIRTSIGLLASGIGMVKLVVDGIVNVLGYVFIIAALPVLVIGVIEYQAFDAVGLKGGEVLHLAHRCEDAPAFGLEGAGAIGADAGRAAGDDDDGAITHGINPSQLRQHSHIQPGETNEIPVAHA